MTAWPDPVVLGTLPLSRRRLRRLSRRFAGVGVGIPAERLHAIAKGAAPTDDELVDVTFALAAAELRSDQRRGKRGRAQRRCVHWLVVAGSVVVALNLLLCLAAALFLLTQHTSPF